MLGFGSRLPGPAEDTKHRHVTCGSGLEQRTRKPYDTNITWPQVSIHIVCAVTCTGEEDCRLYHFSTTGHRYLVPYAVVKH